MLQKPLFSIRGLDFRLRPRGRPIFLAFGTFPSFEVLLDWRLSVWSDGGRNLTFGGIRPSCMTFKSSFVAFFVVVDVPSTIVGIVDAAKYTDIVLMDESATVTDNLLFTAVSRDLVRRKSFQGADTAPLFSGSWGNLDGRSAEFQEDRRLADRR